MKFFDALRCAIQHFWDRYTGRYDAIQETVKTNYVETYCLGILTEECGETLEQIGKAFRFGIDSPAVQALDPIDTARYRLAEEVGGLKAVIRFIEDHQVLDYYTTATAYKTKIEKLYNSNQRDHLGRPLAPQPDISKDIDSGHTTC